MLWMFLTFGIDGRMDGCSGCSGSRFQMDGQIDGAA
jgi:hypothetical protein